ncbi:adenosine receptor A3-like [Heterodontus francisci]|uniref:adenosine receptor A3-like n=1 Tax=Heterodontus francisci TaxID=7792 RepID=UPI00355C8DDE
MSAACNQSEPDGCSEYTVGDTVTISFMILLLLAIIVGNVLSLVVFLGSKSFRTPQGYLKASLALADLSVGVLVVPYSVYTEIILAVGGSPGGISQPEDPMLLFQPCLLMGPVFAGCTFVSISTIFLLSIERSIAVLKPLHKKLFITKRRTWALIALSWGLSFFLAVIPMVFRDSIALQYSPCSKMCTYTFTSQPQPSSRKIMLLFPAFDFSLLGGTVAINILTFSAIRQYCKVRKLLAESEHPAQSTTAQQHFSCPDIPAAKTIGIVTIAFFASFGPIAVLVVGNVLGYQWCKFSYYAFWILTSNSCWNFIIYSVRDRRFRLRVQELFTSLVLKPTNHRENSARESISVRQGGLCELVLKEVPIPNHTENGQDVLPECSVKIAPLK